MKKRDKQEKRLSKSFASYIKIAHKHLIYRFDLAADINLTIGQAAHSKAIQMCYRGYPDFFLAEPRGDYSGLFIELKNGIKDVYKNDGDYLKKKVKIKSSGFSDGSYDHTLTQVFMHKTLREKGYYVTFGFGLEDCIRILELYLSGHVYTDEKQNVKLNSMYTNQFGNRGSIQFNV